MKTVYLLTIPAYHEHDEIEFRYVVYNEEGTVVKEGRSYEDYRKPIVSGMYGILILLKKLADYQGEAIDVIVNDGALVEQINGTTTTKNKDVLKVADLTRKRIQKFSDNFVVKSVAGDHEAVKEWEEKLLL